MSHTHWLILFVSTSLFSVIFFLISDIAEATRHSALNGNQYLGFANSSIKMVNLPLDIPKNLIEEPAAALLGEESDDMKAPEMKWKTVSVGKGDTLVKIFSHLKLDPKQLHELLNLGKPVEKLSNIAPGDELKFLIVDGKLNELIYSVDDSKALHVIHDGKKFEAQTIDKKLNKRIAHATAVIDHSLFLAAQEAGIPASLTMELANIFNFDIDFVLDVRKGDRFSIIYEEYYANGQRISYGDILAAEFVNNEKTYRAVRYTDNHGDTSYYTPEGQNMRKAFLRTPVDFTRISSKFGMRYHPILNRMRDHKGVDYVAPIGTPVKAAGDGKITHIGHKGGYGNTIIIQHGGKYSTVYAHLSKFKSGLKVGTRIKQGQIIGFVGKSGLATGPHLHYEFRVNGEHRNPLTVKLPGGKPITDFTLTNFKLNTQGYLTLLDTLGKTKLAALR